MDIRPTTSRRLWPTWAAASPSPCTGTERSSTRTTAWAATVPSRRVAFFGTNDLRELERRAADDPKVDTWLDAFGLNVAKYIASLATTVDGKVDVILLTGGIAKDSRIVADIRRRTAFIAPTEVYPGENELDSLAENGYLILDGETKVHRYDKDRLLDE